MSRSLGRVLNEGGALQPLSASEANAPLTRIHAHSVSMTIQGMGRACFSKLHRDVSKRSRLSGEKCWM